MLVAVALRIWAIEIKPPHFDEGVNGWFADQMRKTGFYAYDPSNYHGPLHFYLVFIGQVLFGRELWALRLPAVLSSIGCVWMMLRFDRFFGKPISLWAAAAMAISPAFVFYGRYSIHESTLVFALLLTTWGVFELWRSGNRTGLFAIFAGITGMILTKETVVIHVGCLVLAGATLKLWERVVPSRPDDPFALPKWKGRDLALGTGISLAVIVAFYSGFFHDLRLLRGIALTVAEWFSTGVVEGGHAKPEYDFGPLNFYWVALMLRYEWPALIGLGACFWLVFPSPRRLRYLAIVGAGTLLAYSIITYKTPWCIITMLWPFYFIFAAGIEALRRARPAFAMAVPSIAVAVLVVSFIPSLRLNFLNHSDPVEPYVYVQTSAEVSRLLDPVLGLARENPEVYHMPGQLLLDSYYPLPWVFGDFTKLGYYGEDNWPGSLNGIFVVAEQSKADSVESLLRGNYTRVPFRLRDGQDDCYVWFRTDIFPDVKAP